MAILYSIRNWAERFEVAQSRKVEGPLTWVALPCKHDGLGFRRIMAMPDGPAIYCAWVLMVQVAAKCPNRGVLADENGPLDETDLAIKTGCRQEVFSAALKALSSNKIGWITVGRWEHGGSVLPTQDSTGQDKTGQNKVCDGPPSTATASPALVDPSIVCFPDFPCVAGRKSQANTWRLSDALVEELAAAFPGVDVRGECRKAHVWIKANLERRKTSGGMPAFLNRWMTKAQNSGSGATARPRREFIKTEFDR